MSTTPSRILVAFDFSAPARRALALAKDLGQAGGGRIDVVHVVHDPYEGLEHPPRDSLWGNTEETEGYLDSLRGRLKAEVEQVFGASSSTGIHVVRGDIDEEILALAKQLGADLVIVGTTGKRAVDRFLLGSVSSRVLHRSKIPVLTVP